MNKLKKIFFTTLLLTLLTACDTKKDHFYFMTHHEALIAQLKTCQANKGASKVCTTAMSAANDFVSLIKEREADAQGFGERLLRLQTHVALLNKKLKKSPDDKALEEQVLKEQNQIQILLTVIKVTTPAG